MATGARIGHQAQLNIGDSAGSVFTAVAALESISAPNVSVDSVEVSTMDDPDFWRTFIPGLIDGGEVTISGKLIAANTTQFGANGIWGLLTGRTVRVFRVDLPPAGATPNRFQFSGFFTTFEPEAGGQGDAVTFSASIKVSGPVTQSN